MVSAEQASMQDVEILERYLPVAHFVHFVPSLKHVVQEAKVALHRTHLKFPAVESVQTLAATKIKI